MCVTEKQMSFQEKHSCIQQKLMILSNADLISEIEIHAEEFIYGTALGWSFYKGNRPACL